MNYKEIYDKIIEVAKYREFENTEYYEKHHIIPKCMGGTNDLSNLIMLTAREHFVCHQLLVKIYPKNHKLIYAANMMCVYSKDHNQFRSANRRYSWMRKKLSETLSKSRKGKPGPSYKMSEKGKDNKSDSWEIIHPNGFVEIILGLNRFCKKFGLNASTMSSVARGERRHHKNFKIKKLTNKSGVHDTEWIPIPRNYEGRRGTNNCKVKINGIIYDSYREAQIKLKTHYYRIKKLNEFVL